MDSKRFARLGEIFAHARDLSPVRRSEYLDGVCGDDAELRGEVEELLDEDARPDRSAVDRALADDAPLGAAALGSLPRQIGGYRILGICGSGGMGTVYEAADRASGRRVALKVIQAGVVRPELLRRFRREAEILARLDHPCIARVFEAGEFEQGAQSVPYFVMEFVEGLPALEFAQRHALDVAARLDIFQQICDAIDHAHRRGVVHRDLKPDNILVGESARGAAAGGTVGQPKILDFGVAGLVEADTRVTLVTGAGQLLGSVPYMSPEQATGDTQAIGPRSDVYALGVVVFELLTGRLPYAVRERPLADALHEIRHGEPTRLGSADPALRGDLDTIVGACLEKDLDRRYPSVAALADDLRRYRGRQRIHARPPSTWQQFRRFTERNRTLVGGALTTAAAILLGAVIAVVLAIDATTSANTAHENQLRSDRQAYRAGLAAASALLEADPDAARRTLDEIPATMRGWEWRHLSAARTRLLLEFGDVRPPPTQPLGNWPVDEMFVLGGGDQVIAATSDTRFCLWETRTGRAVREFDAPAAVRVWAAATGGALLAAALKDGRVVVADPRQERPTWSTWSTTDRDVRAIAADPSGRRIALHFDAAVRFGRPDAWHDVSVAPRGPWRRPLLAFGPDGAALAVLPVDGLALWDAATGAALGMPMASTQVHWSVAFAPDGRVASGQMRREIRLFDPRSGGYDVELLGHNGPVLDLAVSARGRVVSVSDDATIRVWDPARSEPIAILDAPATVKAEFVDEDHILSLTGGRLRLWTLREGRARALVGHEDHVFSAVFSGDGSLLATVAPWGNLLVWDPLESAPLRRLPAEQMQNVAFDRSGERLVRSFTWFRPAEATATSWPAGGGGRVAAAWPAVVHGVFEGRLFVDGLASAPVGEGLRVFRTEHRVGVDRGSAAAFGDSREFALQPMQPASPTPQAEDLGEYPRLSIGDLAGHSFAGEVAEFLVFAGTLSAAEGEAIDRCLAARRTGSDAPIPELAADSGARLLVHFRAGADSVRCNDEGQVSTWIAANDDRRALTAHGSAGHIQLLPAADGLPDRVAFRAGWGAYRWLETALPGAAGEDRLTVCWLGDYGTTPSQIAYGIGSRVPVVTSAPRDPRVRKWGRRISHSTDGRYVANSGSHDFAGALDVWDTATGECVTHVDGKYHGVAFHPDSVRVAAGRDDGGIDVFDVRTGRLLAAIEAHKGPCWDLAFSPDGTRLASGGNDNALRLWDASTFERLIDLPGHRSYVRGVAWSPDGTMLASACGDYLVRIWDSVSRRERYGQQLERRALEGDVKAQVEALQRAGLAADAVIAEVCTLWPEGSARRRAAMKVLARLQ